MDYGELITRGTRTDSLLVRNVPNRAWRRRRQIIGLIVRRRVRRRIHQWHRKYRENDRALLVLPANTVSRRRRFLFLSLSRQNFCLCPQLGRHFARHSAGRASFRTDESVCVSGGAEIVMKKYSNGVGNVRDLEEMGCTVLCQVDATKMSQHYFLKTQRFDRIVYNFPHVGFVFPEDNGCQIKLNKQLVKGFLMNAKVLIRKEGGEIHVTHKDGDPYCKWDLVKKAEKIGLVLHEIVPFYKDRYPGYDNKRGHGNSPDAPFHLGDCTTFKFRLAHAR